MYFFYRQKGKLNRSCVCYGYNNRSTEENITISCDKVSFLAFWILFSSSSLGLTLIVNHLGLMAAHMDAETAAQSKTSNFQYDVCMCANDAKLNQTTAAFSKSYGLWFKLRFMQHLTGGFSRLDFLSGHNYNTREQKQHIQQWVTEQRELLIQRQEQPLLQHYTTSDSRTNKLNGCNSAEQFIKGIFFTCPVGHNLFCCFSTQIIFSWNIFCVNIWSSISFFDWKIT